MDFMDVSKAGRNVGRSDIEPTEYTIFVADRLTVEHPSHLCCFRLVFGEILLFSWMCNSAAVPNINVCDLVIRAIEPGK